MNKFHTVEEYKVNTQKTVVFLYDSKEYQKRN
jgi:hypothetical protein